MIRYGRNVNLKESTAYFVGDYQEVIERFSSLRDLGVEINEEGTFTEHIIKEPLLIFDCATAIIFNSAIIFNCATAIIFDSAIIFD